MRQRVPQGPERRRVAAQRVCSVTGSAEDFRFFVVRGH
jgi:hypothetical protein